MEYLLQSSPMEPSRLLDWKDQTCVVMASGPSLTDEQVALVQGKFRTRVITTNTTWIKAPWADVFYACDLLWWKTHAAALKVQGKISKCWTQDRASAERWGLNYVRQSARPGLGEKTIQVNGNSGFGAINLAYLFGCRRILVLGMDMREIKGRKHWHPDHPVPMVQKQQFGEWIHKGHRFAADLKAAGCVVVNCTPGSALQCFPASTLEKELG